MACKIQQHRVENRIEEPGERADHDQHFESDDEINDDCASKECVLCAHDGLSGNPKENHKTIKR
jgi:hypothetical protein